jgi:lysophospholipase L1-like esterase
LVASIVVAGCGKIKNDPPSGEAIVAFGDSLTAGTGAEAGGAYPDHLSKFLGEPVLNRGVSGDTTEDGLKRLDKDVLSANPRLVIVWLGANDVLRQVPPEAAVENLGRIVDLIQARGAMVVLVGVPNLPFRPSLNDGVVRLAGEKECLYVPNPMSGILTDPELKSDQVHPNSKGYELIAKRIAKKVKKYARGS